MMMLSLAALMVSAMTPDKARLAAIPLRLREFVDAGKVPGVVVLVRRHGRELLFDAEGWANIKDRTPMRRDTVFQIMSMTKPVTAIAVVMCAEAGLLNLDDPIEKYLPDFHNVKVKRGDSLVSPSTRPTIRHLLTHTAGFGSIDPGGLDDDAKRKVTLGVYADMLAKEPLIGDPGEAIRYSGPGFATLGRIVEVVSKMPLERFMEERIFRPLGMRDTTFFAPEAMRPRLAYTYMLSRGQLEKVEENPFRIGAKFANPAGGLYSTADDMATLLQCVVEGGKWNGYRLLSPAGIAAMTAVQTADLRMDGNDAQGFGLGFAVVKSPAGQMSLKPIGSYGHTGAYGTEFWTDPKTGTVVVFMGQGFENVTEVRKTFNTMVNAALAP